MTLSPRVPLSGRVGALWCVCLSIEVLPSFVGFSTLIMAGNKQHHKNDANTGKVPQEVAKENSRTLQSVSNDDIQHRWHQSVRNLPLGQRIDIPYLKQLAMKEIVPIALVPSSMVRIGR